MIENYVIIISIINVRTNVFGTKQRPLGRPRQNKNTKSTKETILEVATRLFLTQNYQVVSMDEVAKVCGVTKATVYYYYSTKADLFTATTEMMVRIREKYVSNTLYKQNVRRKIIRLR